MRRLWETVCGVRVGDYDPLDPQTPFIVVWSLVHGLATLLLTGNLPAALGRDPDDVTRRVSGCLFPSTTNRGRADQHGPGCARRVRRCRVSPLRGVSPW